MADSTVVTSSQFTTNAANTVDSDVVTSNSFVTGSIAPSITNGPFTVSHNEQIVLEGENLDTVTSVTYANISVSIDSQSTTSLTFTVPDAYTNGLGFTITHSIVVENDNSEQASTQNTLQVPSDVFDSGDVSGYDNIDSSYDSWFDDTAISVVDGDYWITFNPNNLNGLVTNSDGTFEANEIGDFTGRVLDTSDNTDGPDGTWTELRTITIEVPSPSITNGPFTASHNEQITLEGDNLDLVTSVTYSGMSVSIDSQSTTSLTFTVPDAYVNGLGFSFIHFIVASDGTNDDSTQNTLQAPSDAHANGEVSGYDNIDSSFESWFDDTSVSVVDGDYWITFNRNNLDGLVTNSDGTFEANETGSFFGRVLDTSNNTDGPDGTWTVEREIVIEEDNVTFDQVTAGPGSITLSWNSIGSALGYQIEYGPSVSGEQGQHGPYEIIDVGNVTEYTIENLDGNQVYDVRIRYYE